MGAQRIRGIALGAMGVFALSIGACSQGGGGGGRSTLVVERVEAAADAVGLGELNVPVTMTIRNSFDATVGLLSLGLTFTQGPTDVAADYLVIEDPANPIGVPAKSSLNLTFLVSVQANASPGMVELGGFATGQNQKTAEIIGPKTADKTDAWDVREVVIRTIHPPEGAAAGGIMKIHGHHFSDTASENTVLLDGNPVGIVYADHHLIRAMVPGATPLGWATAEVVTNGKTSNPYPYEILSGGVSWVVETEPNDNFGSANPFSLDMGQIDVQSATIAPVADLDYFRITYNPANFSPNSSVELDIDAQVSGSLLDSIVTVYDQNFAQIGRNDDSGSRDSFLSIPLPSSGEFYARVENFFSAGGPNYFYDLSIAVRGPNTGSNTLFNPTFSDPSVSGYGVSMGDITGDALPEILGSFVAVNQGDGTFVRDRVLASFAHSVTFGDVDNDGDNDLWVSMHGAGSNIFYRNDGYPTLTNVTIPYGLPIGGSIFIGLFVDYDQDGWLDILMVDDFVVQLYLNDGTGTSFSLLTGIGLDSIMMTGHCSSAAFGDYDNDGDQDLFIVRDGGSTDLLMENVSGMFTDVTATAGVGGPSIFFDDGYSVEWADFDNDGYLDIYVSNYTNALPNYVYHNQQNRTFNSASWGIENTPTYDNDGSAADFNNDGWMDILVSDLLYINLDGSGFREVSAEYGLGAASSWMATLGDADGDGAVDIFDSLRLYKNQGNGLNWIELELVGGAPTPGKSNRSAIGTRVNVTAGSLSMIREVNGGSGYVGQHDLTVHFGLGLELMADQVEILWPSGTVQTLTNIPANQRLVVVEN